MLYRFKSRAHGDVIMTQNHGQQILELIGKNPDAKGVIAVQDMPAAIEKLKTAVVSEDNLHKQDASARKSTKHSKEFIDSIPFDRHSPHEGVTLRQRAWPLIEMMKDSFASQKDIVWGV